MLLTPDIGVPYEPALKYVDLVERARAVCNTTQCLKEFGAEFPVEEQDRETAAVLITAYANDPTKASKAVTNAKASALRPASIVIASNVLTEFNHKIVTESVAIRNLVTNKLLLETENPNPQVRLKALDMLGKISDVGLFTDKSEVIVTHQSTSDLRERLKQKLHRMIRPDEDIVDIVDDQ